MHAYPLIFLAFRKAKFLDM